MYQNSKDTITAISTPLGKSGLGIIRLSGPKAIEITDSFFKGKTLLAKANTHTLHHGFISDKSVVIDEVVVSVFKTPNSYTGEDIIEISAHGGPVILKDILGLCLASGARLAEPGEFTYRAFINLRMDLTKAEAVCDLISSKSTLAARASMNQLAGSFLEKIISWRKQIVDLLTNIEAALDHSEEDIKFVTNGHIKEAISTLIKDIAGIKKTAVKAKYLRQGLKVTIIGKPNTGKSSLLNALLEKERAIVTEHPGTTRDTIEEVFDLKGIPVVLTDTAGLRADTSDPVEKIGQKKALDCLKDADVILWVLDNSGTITQEDNYISEQLTAIEKKENIILILNKIDLPGKLNEDDLNRLMPSNSGIVKISALKGLNLDSIEEAIVSCFAKEAGLADEPFLANERHLETLTACEAALNNSLRSVTENESEELIAFNLREVLNLLGELSGENVSDEVLENIFSKFCVGK